MITNDSINASTELFERTEPTALSAGYGARMLPPNGLLPLRLSVLLISAQPANSDRVEQSLVSDRICHVEVARAYSVTEGLESLRQKPIDVILVIHDEFACHALALLDAMNNGGADRQAVVVLMAESRNTSATACLESGAHACMLLNDHNPRDLLWQLTKASNHEKLLNEHHRLRCRMERQRSLADEEVARFLDELTNVTFTKRTGKPSQVRLMPVTISEPTLMGLLTRYEALLKAYVMMGGGTMGEELTPFAEELLGLGLSHRLVLQLHLAACGRVTDELGPRGSRHVVHRGMVLALDLLLRLSDLEAAPD
jgi:CheY-like chemotaxis protein